MPRKAPRANAAETFGARYIGEFNVSKDAMKKGPKAVRDAMKGHYRNVRDVKGKRIGKRADQLADTFHEGFWRDYKKGNGGVTDSSTLGRMGRKK